MISHVNLTEMKERWRLRAGICLSTRQPTFTSLKSVKDFLGFEPLSNVWKMPEYSFNIPAQECKAGGEMINLKGSICEGCYAYNKGRYRFSNVINSMYNKLEFAISDYFIPVMTYVINKRKVKYFRWFDSGDIQDENMLDNICNICRATPDTKHWLPTKEWKMVTKYIQSGHKIPDNLDIRLSGLYIDGPPPTKLANKLGLNTSTVVTKKVFDKLLFKCPSSKQENQCRDCRACWTKGVKNVPYKYH